MLLFELFGDCAACPSEAACSSGVRGRGIADAKPSKKAGLFGGLFPKSCGLCPKLLGSPKALHDTRRSFPGGPSSGVGPTSRSVMSAACFFELLASSSVTPLNDLTNSRLLLALLALLLVTLLSIISLLLVSFYRSGIYAVSVAQRSPLHSSSTVRS